MLFGSKGSLDALTYTHCVPQGKKKKEAKNLILSRA
jgi:hypothetical protein